MQSLESYPTIGRLSFSLGMCILIRRRRVRRAHRGTGRERSRQRRRSQSLLDRMKRPFPSGLRSISRIERPSGCQKSVQE